MKILSLIILYLFGSFATTSSHIDINPENGLYFLAQTSDNGILVHDDESDKVYAIEHTPIISNKDFKNVRIVVRDFKPNPLTLLEGKFNQCGKRNWTVVRQRIEKSKETIVFVFDGKILTEMSFVTPSALRKSHIDIPVESKYLESVAESLQSKVSDCK
jgi:hypothetical protein